MVLIKLTQNDGKVAIVRADLILDIAEVDVEGETHTEVTWSDNHGVDRYLVTKMPINEVAFLWAKSADTDSARTVWEYKNGDIERYIS